MVATHSSTMPAAQRREKILACHQRLWHLNQRLTTLDKSLLTTTGPANQSESAQLARRMTLEASEAVAGSTAAARSGDADAEKKSKAPSSSRMNVLRRKLKGAVDVVSVTSSLSKRFQAYQAASTPLLASLATLGRLVEVSAEGSIEEVYSAFEDAMCVHAELNESDRAMLWRTNSANSGGGSRDYVLVTGPPKVGRDTQCNLIEERLELDGKSFIHLRADELMMEEAFSGSSLGEQLKVMGRTGSLIPGQMVADVLKSRIDSAGFLGRNEICLVNGLVATPSALDAVISSLGPPRVAVALTASLDTLSRRAVEALDGDDKADDAVVGIGPAPPPPSSDAMRRSLADKRRGEVPEGGYDHLMLVSSLTPDIDDFCDSCKSAVMVVRYDFSQCTVAQLVSMVEEARASASGGKDSERVFKTIALANHGPPHTAVCNDAWGVLAGVGCNMETGDAHEGIHEIFRAMASAAAERIDLLACSLSKTLAGMELVEYLETEYNINFTASETVNTAAETDCIDVQDLYFHAADLDL